MKSISRRHLILSKYIYRYIFIQYPTSSQFGFLIKFHEGSTGCGLLRKQTLENFVNNFLKLKILKIRDYNVYKTVLESSYGKIKGQGGAALRVKFYDTLKKFQNPW